MQFYEVVTENEEIPYVNVCYEVVDILLGLKNILTFVESFLTRVFTFT